MDAIVFYPENEEQFNQLMSLANDKRIKTVALNDEEKRRLAAILLAKLAQKNLKAYATDDEIISVVEEVRHERYGKGN